MQIITGLFWYCSTFIVLGFFDVFDERVMDAFILAWVVVSLIKIGVFMRKRTNYIFKKVEKDHNKVMGKKEVKSGR